MTNAINYWWKKWLAEKKKVAELEEQVKTAEDHAYFAGSETMREKLIEKACQYVNDHWDELLVYDYNNYGGCVFNRKKTVEQFRKAMEG